MFLLNDKRHKRAILHSMGMVSLLCLLLFISPPLLSQVSQGGKPLSFAYPELKSASSITFSAPDIEQVRILDDENLKLGRPLQVGVSVTAGIDLFEAVEPEVVANGSKIWRLELICAGALALGVYFDEFQLGSGYTMFIYSKKKDHLIGSFTLYNNHPSHLFATELVPGDALIIEINAPSGTYAKASCRISELSYVYRDFENFPGSRGTSDDCEVNINCPEGDNWQYQKHGIARIYVKEGGGYFWCTGSLVNNTLQNNDPYFLTASHCAEHASEADFLQWLFYFNYEAPGCENPTSTPSSNSMTGALKLANASTSGSDFILLRLADSVPEYYEPYYNGWSIENIPSPRGVTIHHPAGDVKKISTYTVPISSSMWSGTPDTHWEVFWSETETNWGVTEGGSSGSPLFDNTGKIIGTLTGGQAACDSGSGTGPDKPDYYGKFSYSWDQNGTAPEQQLKYWLDPINLGVSTLPGKYSDLTAAFQASETLILAGNSVEFANLSSGLPISWEWLFEGGIPETYSGPDPVVVIYPQAGRYDVRLIVSDGLQEDTLFLKEFINVVGEVFPNPTNGLINIFLEEELPSSVIVQVFNMLGQIVYADKIEHQTYPLLTLDLSRLGSGVYTIRLQLKQRYLFARVLIK